MPRTRGPCPCEIFQQCISGRMRKIPAMPKRRILSDEKWKKVGPLLPELESRGRPWGNNRECLEGILWVLRTGARWRDLPNTYPSPATCWRRLRMWEADRTWERVWRALLSELDGKGCLDWKESFADATFVQAQRGATQLARPSVARVRSACWWSTARVYRSEYPYTPPRRRRSRSSRKP